MSQPLSPPLFHSILFYSLPSCWPQPRLSPGPASPDPLCPLPILSHLFLFSGPAQRAPPGPFKAAALRLLCLGQSRLGSAQTIAVKPRSGAPSLLGLRPPPFFPAFFPVFSPFCPHPTPPRPLFCRRPAPRTQ